LDRPQRAALNFHNAGLPEYQGHNCCNHALLNEDRSYRTTVHHLSFEVDRGDIAYETVVDVDGDETAHSLYVKSNAAAISLFEKAISALDLREPLPRRAQSGEPRFFHRNSIDELRDATNVNDTRRVDRIARALYFPPFDPAFILRSGERQPLLPARRADSVGWTRVFGRAMPGDDRLKSENVR
jgi:methionyl-tRNA formyltransferase